MIWLWGYVIGGLVASRWLYRSIHSYMEPYDAMEEALTCMLVVIAMCMWPIILCTMVLRLWWVGEKEAKE